MAKINSNYYKKYIGQYAKRFYTPFEHDSIFPIIDFKLEPLLDDLNDKTITVDVAYIQCVDSCGYDWWWDIEDCVIISHELPIIDDERIANINHPAYHGFDPFTQMIR